MALPEFLKQRNDETKYYDSSTLVQRLENLRVTLGNLDGKLFGSLTVQTRYDLVNDALEALNSDEFTDALGFLSQQGELIAQAIISKDHADVRKKSNPIFEIIREAALRITAEYAASKAIQFIRNEIIAIRRDARAAINAPSGIGKAGMNMLPVCERTQTLIENIQNTLP